jgi:hypothetical protein
MATTSLTEDDEGKSVVTTNGDEVGIITEVRAGTAYVDPDPSTFDSIKAKLDWGDADQDAYPLDASQVADVTDDEVRLR